MLLYIYYSMEISLNWPVNEKSSYFDGFFLAPNLAISQVRVDVYVCVGGKGSLNPCAPQRIVTFFRLFDFNVMTSALITDRFSLYFRLICKYLFNFTRLTFALLFSATIQQKHFIEWIYFIYFFCQLHFYMGLCYNQMCDVIMLITFL